MSEKNETRLRSGQRGNGHRGRVCSGHCGSGLRGPVGMRQVVCFAKDTGLGPVVIGVGSWQSYIL